MDRTNTYIHTFKEPFEYAGKEYKELVFEFGNLKGKDMIAVNNEILATGGAITIAEYDVVIQCKLAARAAKVGSDVIENLPIKDFNKITQAMRNFLLGTSLLA
ncbi:MAG: phage tail assembly protein [Clostridia bacterium]|nr:phage tail assembly protein [Clostridia bacterium]